MSHFEFNPIQVKLPAAMLPFAISAVKSLTGTCNVKQVGVFEPGRLFVRTIDVTPAGEMIKLSISVVDLDPPANGDRVPMADWAGAVFGPAEG